MASRFTFPARSHCAARQRQRILRPSIERLESRVVLNGAQLPPLPQYATTLQFEVPAHIATKGVQFGFYGTGATGQQYMQADSTFADVSTLTSPDLPLVTVVAGASQVASVQITGGGTQYTTAPTVTFAPAPTGGVTATGTAMVSGGVVTGITITNAGYGYTSPPHVTVSGGGGTGATATAALGQTYTTTQTVTIPVPQVQNVSSALPFFVGAVASGVLPINSSLVATPTSSSAGDAVYGFFELNNSVELNQQQVVVSSTLDVDVTTVDQFGIPFRVEFLQADKSPITTNYPYNQGVGTLAGLDRASIFEAFKAEHPTGDPWSASWAQGAYDAHGQIDPSGTPIRLVPTRSLLTDPAYDGQLGGLATYYDGVLDAFFDFYKTNDFVYWQGSQGGSGLNPAPNLGTFWSGRTVTVPGTYSTTTAVDPRNTFGIEALQLTGQTGITGITVTNNGMAGYASPPTVTIAAPDQAGGVQATATVIMAGVVNQQGVGLSVAAIRIDNPGSGYTTVPTVTFTGGGPAPTTIAAATATVGQGGVSGINLTNDGTGYVSAPTVTIAAPDQANGVQATAVAVVDIISGMVTGITITNAGSGYTTRPLVSFTGGGAMGTPAVATAIINEFPGCVVNIYNPIAIQANANSLPSWMTTGTSAVQNPNWNNASPSAMVAGCAQAFASNAVDPGVNDPTPQTPNSMAEATPLGTALGEIENVIVSAFSRGIATMPSKTAFSNSDPSQRALLSPQQFLAGTSNAPISWTADPSGQNLSGGTLTPGTTYLYAVTTVDAAGNETVPTRTVQVQLNSQQNAAHLQWSPTTLPLVAAFRIYRGTSPQNLKLVGQVANSFTAPATGFTDGDPNNQPPANAGVAPPYQFYEAGQTYDAVSKFLHEQFINGLGYGFAFDDQGNFSTNVEFGVNAAPPITRIVINDWGQAERFDVTGPSTATAGTMFQATVTAEVGDILAFTSSDPQAVLPASGAYNPAATSAPITLKTAGVQTVTLSDQTGRQAVFSVTVSPGQAAQLGFVGQPTFAYAKRFMKTPVSVQVQDAFGNAVALGGSRVSLAFVSTNGATLLGQTTANTAANGVATFPRTGPTTGLRVSKPGNYALTATSSPSAALTVARSQAFSISMRAKTTVVAPPRVTVNVPFVITVRGPDQYFQDTVTFRLNPAGNGRVVDADGVLQPLNGFKYTFTAADLGVKRFTLSLGAPIGVRTLAAYLFTAPDLSGQTKVTVIPASSRIRFAGLVRPGA